MAAGDLSGTGGEVRMTVHITRKATGKTETVELVGRTTPEQHGQIMNELNKEQTNGSNALDSK